MNYSEDSGSGCSGCSGCGIGRIRARLRPPGGSAAWKIGRGGGAAGSVTAGGAGCTRDAVQRS